MWPENIPMLSMLPRAFAEHGKAREAWGAWGNHGLPMNSMPFPLLPIPGKLLWKVYQKDNININRRFENFGCTKGVKKVNFSPKGPTTLKISYMKP